VAVAQAGLVVLPDLDEPAQMTLELRLEAGMVPAARPEIGDVETELVFERVFESVLARLGARAGLPVERLDFDAGETIAHHPALRERERTGAENGEETQE
jgi:hypothetical protein